MLESSLSITDAYCTVHCVDRDGKGKGFRPGSSFLFRRHFQIMASVCSLIKSLFEMASLSRCLKVHNRVKRVKMTPFKYFLLLIDRNGGIWGTELLNLMSWRVCWWFTRKGGGKEVQKKGFCAHESLEKLKLSNYCYICAY